MPWSPSQATMCFKAELDKQSDKSRHYPTSRLEARLPGWFWFTLETAACLTITLLFQSAQTLTWPVQHPSTHARKRTRHILEGYSNGGPATEPDDPTSCTYELQVEQPKSANHPRNTGAKLERGSNRGLHTGEQANHRDRGPALPNGI